MNYIDLFAGAGGLSEGFRQIGFDAIAHVEINGAASNTLKTRACFNYLERTNNLELYYSYLRKEIDRDGLYRLVPEDVLSSVINVEISNKTIQGVFNTIDRRMTLHPEWNGHVDLIIGGPPCQAYSILGRSIRIGKEKKTNTTLIDPRNFLYKLYCQFLSRYQPSMFVFENVPGLLTAGDGTYFRNLKKYMKRVGYELEAKELNASDFGVLQNRKRIILVGWLKNTNYSYPVFNRIRHNYLVNSLFFDLPAIQPGEDGNQYTHHYLENTYVNEFNIRTQNDVLTQHVARPHNERDREIYRIAIELWNDGHNRLMYNNLPDGLITRRNLNGFLDRYKVVEGDLQACHTIIAHIAKDGHYYIFPDFDQARSLSVREAARIQSFPDNYFFEGGRTAAFTQIGNAVPPLMAAAIARSIMEQLQNG